MSVIALSPVAPEPPSPMVTSVTPTLDPDTSDAVNAAAFSLDPQHQEQNGVSSPRPGPSREPHLGPDLSRRSQRPPPLHTGADWKVVLHLPEIEKWLRATSDRVTQLSHSVGQDTENRHVDAHLVQLKDICEDISDHVEQIHALLETEFSLKLLSYSVNIIVDIRTVQLLWHQLRVSVLVLKERLLQGLQDPNGNYTRQTDILQAFSQDQHQTRLDALTDVDDCGQLTIRCSQDYFSLDCGITAFELSDYSPGDEPEGCRTETGAENPFSDQDLDLEPGLEDSQGSQLSDQKLHNSLPELNTPGNSINHAHTPSGLPTVQCGTSIHSESVKRPLQGVSLSTDASPTQPSLPKRAALFSDGGTRTGQTRGRFRKVNPLSGLQFQAELSRSTPSLMDPPDRTKFWLELHSVYPEHVSQSYESLQVMNINLQRSSRLGGGPEGGAQRPMHDQRSPSGLMPPPARPPPLPQEETPVKMEWSRPRTHAHSEGGSDSLAPSPVRDTLLSSDPDASGEESDPRPAPTKNHVWMVKRHGHKNAVQVSSKSSPNREHWYGSEEFLALPDQLRKTEMLAMNLESLAQTVTLDSAGCDSIQDALQDVDDWDLTELNPDWDVGESGDDVASPLPPSHQFRQNHIDRFSSASSSDMAPSLDESIESGPLSDLTSEDDEGRRSAERRPRLAVPPVDIGGLSLVQQLLEDVQKRNKDPDVWKKIECFVQQLDGFISWLQEALDSTENWTQPRQDLDSLRAYLDTHLSFKLNVDSRTALKDSITEEGRALLSIITSHQSALKDILQMVSGQWDQLQRQIRRQHAWMLRALRCIQARLFYAGQSHEAIAVLGIPAANRVTPGSSDGLQVELISSQFEAQRAALEQMAIRLSSLQYPTSANRRQNTPPTKNDSLQEFEAEYHELWDWLMDMDAMVTDSHQLMMSEEQRHHLFKNSHAELVAMETRRTSVLGRAESLKRSGSELPAHFHRKVHNLTHTWTQLENILSEHSGPGPSRRNRSADTLRVGVATDAPRSALSPLTNSLLEQLEARIKELKAWLRDTELLIFNSCLRQDKDASAQLGSFKSLCSEIRARRRGVSSVLKLCQKLLQQSQPGPLVEVGPEAEQHQEALQLLSINLERRWEAIVMQALQWQNRLKRELGEQQVPGNFLEPGLVDLHQLSPVPAGPTGLSTDDSWEWDETDMTITESEPQEAPEPDLTLNLPMELDPPSASTETQSTANNPPNNNNNIYQVYSLHNVELYQQPQFPCSSLMHKNKTRKTKLLLKSLSKDSSFSSIESLPDLLGGLIQGRGSGRRSSQSASSRRSGSESGIDTGDTETITTNSEIQGEEEDQEEEERKDVTKHHQMTEENLKEKVWRRPRRGGGEAVEILINGRGILTPADSDSDFETGGPSISSSKLLKQVDQYNFEGLATPPDLHQASSPVLSQGSSLESLLALGVELFPNSKEVLHRSTSLETCLVPGRSPEGEAGGGTMGSLREVNFKQNEDWDQTKNQQGEPSSEELSRRTLDLLKRLENIQSPLTAKMTRSVSDMTLQSCSPPRLPASPSLGGRHAPLSGISRKGPPSLINESSATASLTELSSTEDSSLGSEDFAKNQRHLFLDPANANSYRRKHGSSRAGPEEADAASLSMVVNVSACTDEDEDDSDLLSSSTLTLTEEELGVRDGEDEEEERLSGTSSANDEDDDEDDMEGSYILGLEYMKRELQGWIRTPRTSSSSSKTEAGLRDELQCGTFTTSSQNKEQPCFINRSPLKFTETTIGNKTKSKEEEEENRRNATRSYISQFVDDVENGNVDQSCLKRKDEDDELLREESSIFTNKGETLRESYLFGKAGVCDVNEFIPTKESTKSCEQLPFLPKRSSSLVGQLSGELPCHSSTLPSPPSLSPVEDCRSHDALCSGKPVTCGRKAITIQEKFKFSSIVTEETKREVRDKKSSLPPKKRHHSHPSCCSHLPSASSFRPIKPEETKKENVHDFVMEIIDMTSLALKCKENQSEEPNQAESNPDQSSAPLTQIRDKVLEHSHRPLHLRKGDFYNYLSLSSHDSDCGEVVQCPEEKGSTPAPYTIPSYTSPNSSPEVFATAAPLTPGFRETSCSLELDTEKHKEEKAGQSPAASPAPSPDIRDEETLFPTCTEEVYLGPPLCYSMALPKKPRRDLGFSEPEFDGIELKPIEYLSPDGGERRSYQNQKSPPSPVDYTSLSNLRRPPLDARRVSCQSNHPDHTGAGPSLSKTSHCEDGDC